MSARILLALPFLVLAGCSTEGGGVDDTARSPAPAEGSAATSSNKPVQGMTRSGLGVPPGGANAPSFGSKAGG